MSQLLISLANSYRRRGWTIVSNSLDEYENIPVEWKGPKPDLIAVRDNERIAVFVETPTTLNYDNIAAKWRAVIEKNDVGLSIAVREKESLERVKDIAEHYGISLTIQLRKRTRRRYSNSLWNSFWQNPKIDWFMVAAVLIVLVAFSILFLPDVLAKFKIHSFYQPFDRERQMEYMKRQEQEKTTKSEPAQREGRARDVERKRENEELRSKYE